MYINRFDMRIIATNVEQTTSQSGIQLKTINIWYFGLAVFIWDILKENLT